MAEFRDSFIQTGMVCGLQRKVVLDIKRLDLLTFPAYVFLCVLAQQCYGYDYSNLMPGISGLPLEYPEKLFVLRFTREELLSQPIWSGKVDAILIPQKAESPIRIGAEKLRDSLLMLRIGRVPIIEIGQAHDHLQRAIDCAVAYRNLYLPIIKSEEDHLWNFKMNATRKYLGCILAILREAAYLFDQEFGNMGLLDLFDKKMSLNSVGLTSAQLSH